jgi:hypothetical protein
VPTQLLLPFVHASISSPFPILYCRSNLFSSNSNVYFHFLRDHFHFQKKSPEEHFFVIEGVVIDVSMSDEMNIGEGTLKWNSNSSVLPIYIPTS